MLVWLLDLLLYLPPLASAPHVPPPGLSRSAAKRVCGKLDDAEVRGELLAAKKRAALRLLGASTDDGALLFAAAETLPHWIVASCDNDHAVATLAETTLRRLQAAASLDDPALIDALISLILGAQPTPGAPSPDPLTSRSAASVAVRLQALSYLQRSVAAASRFPGTMQVRLAGPHAPPPGRPATAS